MDLSVGKNFLAGLLILVNSNNWSDVSRIGDIDPQYLPFLEEQLWASRRHPVLILTFLFKLLEFHLEMKEG